MAHYKLIPGAKFLDTRGKLNFFNDFDMIPIVRFYEIEQDNIAIIRAWQAHKKEMKWFYCHKGAFVVHLIRVDDFENPSPILKPKRIILKAIDPMILEISGGFATGFKAIEENSSIQVFSNFKLEDSKNDDFRYPIEKWDAKW